MCFPPHGWLVRLACCAPPSMASQLPIQPVVVAHHKSQGRSQESRALGGALSRHRWVLFHQAPHPTPACACCAIQGRSAALRQWPRIRSHCVCYKANLAGLYEFGGAECAPTKYMRWTAEMLVDSHALKHVSAPALLLSISQLLFVA
jgi:hypothetical protein